MNSSDFGHITVLKDQAVEMLALKPGMIAIDCTAGGGGHTELILETIESDGLVLAFDQDPNAIDHLSQKFDTAISNGKVRLVNQNFSQLKNACDRMNLQEIDAILADIGVSSPQIDNAERGFSFQHDGPLDMRMNPESGEDSAADFVNNSDEREIARVIFQLGEEPKSRFIAKAICERRQTQPFTRTADLAEVVKSAIHYSQKSRKHPATKTFQALRIHVNKELEVLEQLIRDGFDILKPKGRMAIITFHSLEDRIVKKAFNALSKPPKPTLRGIPLTDAQIQADLKGKIIKPFPQLPSKDELNENPRSRSAKLRVIEKN